MSRNPKLRLEDIIEACDLIASYVMDYDFERFQQDNRTRDAVIRCRTWVGSVRPDCCDSSAS